MPAAVALLRAIYDMVDRVKEWEVERGLDGAAAFHARCANWSTPTTNWRARLGIATGARRNRLRRLQRLIGMRW